MKVKALSRDVSAYTGRSGDIHRLSRNAAPALHPFERAREYTRALQATKLDKIMAKPFLAALDQHTDSVHTLATHPNRLSTLFSGSCDGGIIAWDLGGRRPLWSITGAHDGFVRGVSVASSGAYLASCGTDRAVKLWDLETARLWTSMDGEVSPAPVKSMMSASALTDIDCSPIGMIATAGTRLEIWNADRPDPLHGFKWGADTINCVRFSPVEPQLLASCASDRSVILYDLRTSTPVRKLTLAMSSNALAWNPMEAFNFTVANDDSNLYTFDTRKLDLARNVHTDHVGAVMAVHYAPTGKEFVSGGYDRAIRIWRESDGHSREVYVARRMQRVFSVAFSADNRFIVSGSDDANVRLWKAQASATLQAVLPREARQVEYREKIKSKFAHSSEIKRIARHRHVPASIFREQKKQRIMESSVRRKDQNRRAHSKPGSIKNIPKRAKNIVQVDE